jgi:alginate O-acetyltransferase complex protein AlgI
MVFNSILFFAFFITVLSVYNLPISWKAKKVNLVVASSLFYAAWNPLFLILLWISILTDYFVAARIAVVERLAHRRALLTMSLVTNLGMLAFFKYGTFIFTNVQELMARIGVRIAAPHFDILLPVGISFYTFETISYTIDVYRGRERPWTSFLDFAVFLTFFPHLVAGPIVRPHDFLPQCQTERRASTDQIGWGLVLLIVGLFEKIVIADGIFAPMADRLFQATGAVRFRDSWGGALAFSGQIFCDFGGYSLCAIGVALCFGFRLPDNFMGPYASVGFSDFWRRWHISLSSWLRDYLYVPLGGNRKGQGRTYVNLFVTMLLGGLWHGPSWTFVVWGGLHGLYLTGERAMKPLLARSCKRLDYDGHLLGMLVTYLLVCFAWVFFRAPSFVVAFKVASAMVGISSRSGLPPLLGKTDAVCLAVLIPAMLVLHWLHRDSSLAERYIRVPPLVRGLVLSAMLLAILTEESTDRVFIYFQF